MVDTARCYSLVRGRVARVTKLDSCGRPDPGPSNGVVTDGLVTVALTSNTSQGDTITVVNMNGKNCINDVPDPTWDGFSAEITLCGVNPALIKLLTGQDLVVDAETSLATGFRLNTKKSLPNFALEIWSYVSADACAGTDPEYGYFLLPFLKGGNLGDFSIENGAVTFTVTGANTKSGNGWGVGPYNVVAGVSGAATVLATAMDDDDHMHLQLTDIAPPDAACTNIAVGVPATLITAGIPATLTPAWSYTPANLAALIAAAPTKTPTTAWTTGQYVLLEDGSKAHWTGSAWVVGPA